MILGTACGLILNEKLSATEQFSLAAQDHVAFPAHTLHPSGRDDLDRRFTFSAGDRCYCGGARSRAGRASLANSALEKAHINMSAIFNDNKLNVNPGLEVVVASDFCRLGWPSRSKFFNEE